MEIKNLLQQGILWVKKHPALSAIGLIILLILISNSGSSNDSKPQALPQETRTQVQFDIPNLIGKNMDEIESLFGKEISQEPNEYQINSVTEWSKEFKKDEYVLVVTYDYKTRIIKDFFVPASEETYQNKDKKYMMEITNTTMNDSLYDISFIDSMKDPGYITGILISPK
jgi:hypothetical protein